MKPEISLSITVRQTTEKQQIKYNAN